MIGHDLLEGMAVVKAAVDTLRSTMCLISERQETSLIPVYRLVPLVIVAPPADRKLIAPPS
jgi:hypothetical protein